MESIIEREECNWTRKAIGFVSASIWTAAECFSYIQKAHVYFYMDGSLQIASLLDHKNRGLKLKLYPLPDAWGSNVRLFTSLLSDFMILAATCRNTNFPYTRLPPFSSATIWWWWWWYNSTNSSIPRLGRLKYMDFFSLALYKDVGHSNIATNRLQGF